MDRLAPSETMDRLLVYRNLLCAEDHLDEIRDSAVSSDEVAEIDNIKFATEDLRSDTGFIEANSRYHCLVKHYSAAYEGAREVAKATHSESDREKARLTRSLLLWALEKLIGAKVKNCGRCEEDNELNNTSREDNGGRASIEQTSDDVTETEDGYIIEPGGQARLFE